jgi:hypothetical protein
MSPPLNHTEAGEGKAAITPFISTEDTLSNISHLNRLALSFKFTLSLYPLLSSLL